MIPELTVANKDNAPIKIAHLSDSHLLSRMHHTLRGVNPHIRLALILAEIRKKAYDLILFTGDISNAGDNESYQLLRQLLARIQQNMLIIPGNHDHPSLLDTALQENKWIITKTKLPVIVGNWSFLYLDTLVPNHHHGYISEKTIENYNAQLSLIQTDHICLIMHHNPFDVGLIDVDQYKLKNFDDISQKLDPRIKLVVFGHVHLDFTETRGTVVYSATPATCFQAIKTTGKKEKYGYKEYTLSTTVDAIQCHWYT